MRAYGELYVCLWILRWAVEVRAAAGCVRVFDECVCVAPQSNGGEVQPMQLQPVQLM